MDVLGRAPKSWWPLRLLVLTLCVLPPRFGFGAGVYEAFASNKTAYVIGVNNERGVEATLARWTATAAYLGEHIPGYSFSIVPYDHAHFREAVKLGQVDFALTNPGMYIEFETRYKFQRLVTLKNFSLGKPTIAFGSVFFRRADRPELKDFADLRGKRLMAVDAQGFGGWGLGYREMLDADFDPHKELGALEFGGTHDDVVLSVLAGKADAGLVRTDTLERMALEQKIRLEDIGLIHENMDEKQAFPFLLSTRLYPEWPLAAAPHVPLNLRERLVIELLEIAPESKAAQDGLYAGWTVPLNYQSIHQVLRVLRAPPYENYGTITWKAVVAEYWGVILLSLALMVVLLLAGLHFRRLHRALVITQETLNAELVERTRTESLLATQNQLLVATQSRFKEEMKAAHAMQLAILPDPDPSHPRFQGAATLLPAREIGGDFYDYFLLDATTLGVVMGDVSGKGVPAALFMAVTRTFLQMAAQKQRAPGACLAEVNNLLCAENPLELFVTTFYGILDLNSGRFCYANGGHNQPYWLRSDGTVQPLTAGRGMALGVMPDLTFQEATIQMAPGERLFLYTDGVTEAFNSQNQPFDTHRLVASLRNNGMHLTRPLVEGLLQDVADFVQLAEQSDDLTCLAMQYIRNVE